MSSIGKKILQIMQPEGINEVAKSSVKRKAPKLLSYFVCVAISSVVQAKSNNKIHRIFTYS